MADIHPRFESPSTSLLIQAALSTVLLFFLGRFQQLFELTVFAEWLFYMITATTVFVFRKKYPHAERPYRLWGYPLLPAVFVICAAVLLFESYAQNIKGSLLGTGLILTGLPLHWWMKKSQRTS
jgi:APA family basic amino acid/polyamine antiporter